MDRVRKNTIKAVKTALRIKTNAFDYKEIDPIIDACLFDLRTAGIKLLFEGDALILRAIILYAKANFGFDSDSDKYLKSYNMLKGLLCLAGGYCG